MSYFTENVADSAPGNGNLAGFAGQDPKRAVLKPAPSQFCAEVLSPTKVAGHICHGVRIYPLISPPSAKQSFTMKASQKEYDVWRRWEDCLYFQELIEYEYSVMAREKRNRLAAGKGIKKDGIYIHSDQAASFDSLPPGPEASSVALDLHEYIPKLTKKASIFRASEATIAQRGREFHAMVEALLGDDVPTLVKELREIRVVRDFFGIWQRDKDNERKTVEAHKKLTSGKTKSRISVSSSALSMYFSPSKVSLSLSDVVSDSEISLGSSPSRDRRSSDGSFSSPRSARSLRTPARSTTSFSSSEDGTFVSPTEQRPMQRTVPHTPPRARWSAATAASAAPSECPSDVSGVPIMFVSGDERIRARMTIDRNPGLQSLPEDEELSDTMSSLHVSPRTQPLMPVRRARGPPAPERPPMRSGFASHRTPEFPISITSQSTFTSDTNPYHQFSLPSAIPRISLPDSNSSKRSSDEFSTLSDRSSWRNSATSVTSVTTTPSTPDESCSDSDKAPTEAAATPQMAHFSHIPRDSLATVDSFIASSVMEEMFSRRPGSPCSPNSRRSFSVGDRQSRLSFDDTPSKAWDERDDIMAAYFYDPLLRSVVAEEVREDLPEPHREQSMIAPLSTPDRYPKPYQHRPPNQFHLPWSPQTHSIPEDDVSSGSASPSSPISPADSAYFPTTFTIKAVKEDAIVLLRADASMRWLDVRAKIAEKFEAQEGTALTKSFLIGYVPSAPTNATAQPNSSGRGVERGRPRASSTSSVALLQARGGMRTVNSDEEWQRVIASSRSDGKLALRILDRF